MGGRKLAAVPLNWPGRRNLVNNCAPRHIRNGDLRSHAWYQSGLIKTRQLLAWVRADAVGAVKLSEKENGGEDGNNKGLKQRPR